jgi:L-amino acid ligase C-terminal domain 2
VRGCGSKVAMHLMPALTGVDVARVVIRQALGFPTSIEPAPTRHGALHFLIFPRGRVTLVRGIEAVRRMPDVIDACVEPRPGDVIEDVHDGRSRPGHVLVRGHNRDEVQRTITAVRGLIRVDYEHAKDVPPAAMRTALIENLSLES